MAGTSKAKAGGNATKRRTPDAQPAEDAHRWTFLTNHAHVLVLLHTDSELVLREVAAQVGITERAVQRIVQELEEGGFIERERVGRRNQYRILKSNPLRHPIESHCNIADMLNLLTVPKTIPKRTSGKTRKR